MYFYKANVSIISFCVIDKSPSPHSYKNDHTHRDTHIHRDAYPTEIFLHTKLLLLKLMVIT